MKVGSSVENSKFSIITNMLCDNTSLHVFVLCTPTDQLHSGLSGAGSQLIDQLLHPAGTKWTPTSQL